VEILSPDRIGGIVLCGGQSTRMGRPKFSMPFGDETMLCRVVRIVGEVVSRVVVVAAAGQRLPPLPAETIVARDEVEGRGPLGGLAAGLDALRGRVEAAYLSACDVPLLKVAFIRAVIDALGTHEMAVPRQQEFHHPLAAVYRTACEARLQQAIAAGQFGLTHFVRQSDTRFIDVTELRAADPELESLQNVNTRSDYEAALRAAGFLSA
jgi:molybdopterin-guanine dinucleotide biosynthesis protein A